MINIKQVKNDFENGVIISRATWGKVIEAAMQPAQQAHALTDAEIESIVAPLFQNRACQKHDYIVARAIAAHVARKG